MDNTKQTIIGELTKNYSEATSFENYLNIELREKILQEIIKGFVKLKSNRFSKVRVYRNEEEFSNNNISNLLEKIITSGDFLNNLQNIFENNKYGIVINNFELYNDDLLILISDFIKNEMYDLQIPLGGLDLVLFIGNYGFTPFGVHKDYPGGKVIHFNVGKKSKQIYLWNDNEYSKCANNIQNNKDFHHILKNAEKIDIKPGDLFFMQDNIWHIGESNDLTITLALRLNYDSIDKVISEISKDISNNIFSNSFTAPIHFNDEVTPNSLNIVFKEEFRKLDIETFFNLKFIERHLCLKSNYFFNSRKPVKAENFSFQDLTIFRLKYNYRIEYMKRGVELIVFLRGYKLNIPNEDEVVSLIKKLNDNETITYNSLDNSSNNLNGLINILYKLELIIKK